MESCKTRAIRKAETDPSESNQILEAVSDLFFDLLLRRPYGYEKNSQMSLI